MVRAPRRTALVAVLAIGALVGAAAVLAAGSSDWPMGGQNISNTRSNPSSITRDNAKNLKLKWQAMVHGDVSATPAVVGGAVYFPDWAGYLYKLNASTGAVIWQTQISDYTGNPGQVARTAPAVDGNTLYVGTQNTNTANGGQLISINATTGAANWVADISGGSSFAIATQSPIVSNGVVYEGVASSEEGVVAFIPNYPCCHDRGSFSAVRASDGEVLWTTHTVPNIPGYSGNGVWASTAALDPSTSTVYIATGNNYSVPQSVKDCEAGGVPPPASHVFTDSGTE